MFRFSDWPQHPEMIMDSRHQHGMPSRIAARPGNNAALQHKPQGHDAKTVFKTALEIKSVLEKGLHHRKITDETVRKAGRQRFLQAPCAIEAEGPVFQAG
jgi:hypothetical protein